MLAIPALTVRAGVPAEEAGDIVVDGGGNRLKGRVVGHADRIAPVARFGRHADAFDGGKFGAFLLDGLELALDEGHVTLREVHRLHELEHAVDDAARADVGTSLAKERGLPQEMVSVLAGSGQTLSHPDVGFAIRPAPGFLVAKLLHDLIGLAPVVRVAGLFAHDVVVQLVHEAAGEHVLMIGNHLVAHARGRAVARLHARIHMAQAAEGLIFAEFGRRREQSLQERVVPAVALVDVGDQQRVDDFSDVLPGDLVVRELDGGRPAVVVGEVRVGLAVLLNGKRAEVDLLALEIPIEQIGDGLGELVIETEVAGLASLIPGGRQMEHGVHHVFGVDLADGERRAVRPFGGKDGLGRVGMEIARVLDREAELHENVLHVRGIDKVLRIDAREFGLIPDVACRERIEALHWNQKAARSLRREPAGEVHDRIVFLVVLGHPALGPGKAPRPCVDGAADGTDAVVAPEAVAYDGGPVLLSAGCQQKQAKAG